MRKLALILMFSAITIVACNKSTNNQFDENNTKPAAESNSQGAHNDVERVPLDKVPDENVKPDELAKKGNDSLDDNINDIVQNNAKPDNPLLKSSVDVGEKSVSIPDFAIRVNLSDNAFDKLSTEKESIIVAAYYTVMIPDNAPKSYEKYADDSSGEITIADHRVEIENIKKLDNLAIFKDINYSREMYDILREEDRDLQLLINIFSGRKSGPLNLLHCDLYQDNISKTAGLEQTLNCKLIDE